MGFNSIKEVKTIDGSSRSFRLHVHDELSIAHVWKGSTLARINGVEVPICGECTVVIPPGIAHACTPVAGSGWNYTLALLDPAVCSWASEALFAAPWRIVSSSGPLRSTFRSLRSGGTELHQRMLESLLDVLDTDQGRSVCDGVPARSRALRRVMDHLRSHLTGPLSLDELCVIANLSKYHLVRSFKQAYGLTPHAYHLNLRVNGAKARLREGADLATVAADSGFCDQSHLTRVFTRCVGMTPAVYQKATAIPSKTL